MSAARRPRLAVNSCGLSWQSCLAHPSQWTRPRVTAMRLPLLLALLTVVSIAGCKRNHAGTVSVNAADSLSRSQELVAKLAEHKGETSMAIDALERLAYVEPDDAAPLIRRVRLLIAESRVKDARRVGLDAIDRDAENPETYLVTGRAYLADDQVGMAIWMFQKAIELSPDHGYALNNLGFSYLRANRNEEALEVLKSRDC